MPESFNQANVASLAHHTQEVTVCGGRLDAGGLAAAHGVFWGLVQPANTTMFKWRLDEIPADWTRWRDQWEYGHAARATLVTASFGALVWSALPANRRLPR